MIISKETSGQGYNTLSSTIPLEAYEGFNRDSFVIPGTTFPQAVYPFGSIESNTKVYLEGIGDLFLHHVLYNDGDYYVMEVYSRKPASEFIRGIKRYGNFRMYETMGLDFDTAYHGEPKIEIVRGHNSIIKTVYPIKEFKLSEKMELVLEGNEVNVIEADVREDVLALDSFLLIESGEEIGYYHSWIQFDLEQDLIKIDLYNPYAFESIIYDSLGNHIASITDFGALRSVTLTEDHTYAYVSCGGHVNEDFLAPYVIRIYDLKKNEVIFFKRSIINELSCFAIPGSNLGVIESQELYGGGYTTQESMVVDHDKNIMYELHLSHGCQPPVSIAYYSTFCECYFKNGLKNKLEYAKIFTAVPWEFD